MSAAHSRPPTIRLTKPLEEAVRGGHPWVFADALAVPAGLRDGEVVDLVDRRGDFLARGTVEPSSPLAFRSWTLDRARSVDAALVEERLAAALALRRKALRADVTGWRACQARPTSCRAAVRRLRRRRVAADRRRARRGLEATFVAAVRRALAPRAIVVRNPKVEEGAARVVEGSLSPRRSAASSSSSSTGASTSSTCCAARRPASSSTSARTATASARSRATCACSTSSPTPAASRWRRRSAARRA
jgi:hypothetical protein